MGKKLQFVSANNSCSNDKVTYCSWGTIPDDSTDIGVMGVRGVNGVIGFSGKGDIPLWNDEVDCTLGGYRCDVWKDNKLFTPETDDLLRTFFVEQRYCRWFKDIWCTRMSIGKRKYFFEEKNHYVVVYTQTISVKMKYSTCLV